MLDTLQLWLCSCFVFFFVLFFVVGGERFFIPAWDSVWLNRPQGEEGAGP